VTILCLFCLLTDLYFQTFEIDFASIKTIFKTVVDLLGPGTGEFVRQKFKISGTSYKFRSQSLTKV
jgi:hypothetical protein